MPLLGAAKNLQTTTGIVNVSESAAPSANQVLTATGATTATWQIPYEVPLTFGDGLTRTVNDVDVDAAQPGITTATALPWTGLKIGTDGEIPTFDSSGNPAFIAVGTADQVLTSNGAGAAPTFQDAGGGGIPTMKVSTAFETATRFSETATSGTATYDVTGLLLDTTGTTTRAIRERLIITTSNTVTTGSPIFTTKIRIPTVGTTGTAYVGIGAITCNGAGHTFTEAHTGFKVVMSSAVAALYATQADGTTETASAALVADMNDPGTNDFDLIVVKNSTTSIDYYYRKNADDLSSATNLATNLPTTSTSLQVGVSNNSSASQQILRIYFMTYER